MIRFVVVILLMLMSLMLPSAITVPCLALEQSQWVLYSHAASRMLARKNYQRASELYETAAKCGEDEHRRPEEIANTLLNLSDCQIETGSYRDAWTTIMRARAIIESQHLVDEPIAVRLLRREESYYQRQGMFNQAVACQKIIVEKVRTIFGDSTALISEYVILQLLQAAFAHQPRDAAQTGLVALALMKKMKFDPYCDKWLWVFNRTGDSLMAIGETQQAIDCWTDSVNMSIGCRSLDHGGFALGKLVDIAAQDADKKEQAAMIAQLSTLSDKLNAIDDKNEWLQKVRQRLKLMRALTGPVTPQAH